MSHWYHTELEEGEEIVLGVATSSSRSSSSSHENGRLIEGSLSQSERKSGVTNRRVVIETLGDHDATIIIPNASVSRAWIEKSDFMGTAKLNLAAIESSGQAHELGIGFLDEDDEALIRQAFPNAQISISGQGSNRAGSSQSGHEEKPRKKGLLNFLGF